AANASSDPVAQGNVGVGYGATIGKFCGLRWAMKGGVGSICLEARRGFCVGGLVGGDAFGNIFGPWQRGTVAGARHPSGTGFLEFAEVIEKGMPVVAQPAQHTTLGVIITDVALDPLLLAKTAQAGHDGLARAVRPVHTSFDGDTFFAVTTAQRTLP